MRRDLSLLSYAFPVYMFCAIILATACLATGTSFTGYPVTDYYLFIAMAAIPGILGHTLYNWALKHVNASVVSVSLLAEPIGSTFLAFIFLNEVPTSFLVVVGGAPTLVGIGMTAKKARRKKRKKKSTSSYASP